MKSFSERMKVLKELRERFGLSLNKAKELADKNDYDLDKCIKTLAYSSTAEQGTHNSLVLGSNPSRPNFQSRSMLNLIKKHGS